MADVIDLGMKRAERDGPDPECVRKDAFGRNLYEFLLEWRRGAHTYGISLWAYDQIDAQTHVDAMRESLVLVGQSMGHVPA